MPVNSNVENGHLTTSVVTIRTGVSNSENLKLSFRNSGSSTRVVSLFLNGSTDPDDVKARVTLESHWFCEVRITLGNGNTLRAAQDAGSDVYWFNEETLLT